MIKIKTKMMKKYSLLIKNNQFNLKNNDNQYIYDNILINIKINFTLHWSILIKSNSTLVYFNKIKLYIGRFLIIIIMIL